VQRLNKDEQAINTGIKITREVRKEYDLHKKDLNGLNARVKTLSAKASIIPAWVKPICCTGLAIGVIGLVAFIVHKTGVLSSPPPTMPTRQPPQPPPNVVCTPQNPFTSYYEDWLLQAQTPTSPAPSASAALRSTRSPIVQTQIPVKIPTYTKPPDLSVDFDFLSDPFAFQSQNTTLSDSGISSVDSYPLSDLFAAEPLISSKTPDTLSNTHQSVPDPVISNSITNVEVLKHDQSFLISKIGDFAGIILGGKIGAAIGKWMAETVIDAKAYVLFSRITRLPSGHQAEAWLQAMRNLNTQSLSIYALEDFQSIPFLHLTSSVRAANRPFVGRCTTIASVVGNFALPMIARAAINFVYENIA